MRRTLFLAATTVVVAGCDCNRSQRVADATPTQNLETRCPEDFVGTRGPDGPMGETGPRGVTGQTGQSGYAAAGPRGPAGPAGPMGEQGRPGMRGASGEIVMGPAGASGDAGTIGAQGASGSLGSQGSSSNTAAGMTGPAGPAGMAGPAGARGATGESGMRGEALVGPAGPAGRAGPAGARGAVGETGAQGTTLAGLPGPAGPIGPAGQAGPSGTRGTAGAVGVLDCWVNYREFWFDADQSALHNGDAAKAREIATYLKANPSLQLGIDNGANARSNDRRVTDLNGLRTAAVRNALLEQGVPAERISTATFTEAGQPRDGRVALLLRTDPNAPPIVAPIGGTTVAGGWTTSEDFWFDENMATLDAADASKIASIAARMRQDPDLRVGVDSSTDRISPNAKDTSLATQRGDAVRDALIAAGVPSSHITRGAVGDPERQRNRCVAVLMRSVTVARNP